MKPDFSLYIHTLSDYKNRGDLIYDRIGLPSARLEFANDNVCTTAYYDNELLMFFALL